MKLGKQYVDIKCVKYSLPGKRNFYIYVCAFFQKGRRNDTTTLHLPIGVFDDNQEFCENGVCDADFEKKDFEIRKDLKLPKNRKVHEKIVAKFNYCSHTFFMELVIMEKIKRIKDEKYLYNFEINKVYLETGHVVKTADIL